MRDHDDCDEAIIHAQRTGQFGWAEYLASRCELRHQAELAADTPRADAARTVLHPTGDGKGQA